MYLSVPGNGTGNCAVLAAFDRSSRTDTFYGKLMLQRVFVSNMILTVDVVLLVTALAIGLYQL